MWGFCCFDDTLLNFRCSTWSHCFQMACRANTARETLRRIGVGATRRNKVCKNSLKVADCKQCECSRRSAAWKFLVLSEAATQRTSMRVPLNLTDSVSHELQRLRLPA